MSWGGSLRVLDRRGGGTIGLGFSSTSSCSSLADLKDEGDESVKLSIELESLLGVLFGVLFERGRGVSCADVVGFAGRFCVDALGGVTEVLIAANFAGFCLIGGDRKGSCRGPLAVATV